MAEFKSSDGPLRVVGLLIVVVLLLGSAWLIYEDKLWSQTANLTVPWFCSALALGLLIVLIVCGLRGQGPAELPWIVIAGTVVVTGAVLAVGCEIDNQTYTTSGIVGTRWELAGFVVLLLGLFMVARRRRT